MKDFFAQHKYRYPERIATHLDVLQKEPPTLVDTNAFQLHSLALVAVLKTIDTQLRLLFREMKRLLRQHPDHIWLSTIPGLGDLNASRLLVRLGDNRKAYKSLSVLRATAGTIPITRSSGKRRSVRFRRECSHPLRKAFYDLAMNSKRYSPWAKSYFDAQIARGHSRPRANRALANRWVGIIWKLWHNREPYDENVHQANRRQAMSLMHTN